MAFWGIEVKPGKSFTHSFDKGCGRLRISQATLGIGSSTKSSLVQCNVGNKSPVLLCSLLPDKCESCHLELEFEEVEDVVFSVIGPRSVYLTGYYTGNVHRHANASSDSESYGEDIGDEDTDRSNDCPDEDEYEDSFIDDGKVEVSPNVSSDEDSGDGLKDKRKAKTEKHRRRRLKKKYDLSESEDDSISHQQKRSGARNRGQIVESEDDDQLPISTLYENGKTLDHDKKLEEKVMEETMDKVNLKTENGGYHVKESNGESEPVVVHSNSQRGKDLPLNQEVRDGIKAEDKNKKKKRAKEGKSREADEDQKRVDDAKADYIDQHFTKENELLEESATKKKMDGFDRVSNGNQAVEKQMKRKKRKNDKEREEITDKENPSKLRKVGSVLSEIEEMNKKLPSHARTLSNGLIIEELETGAVDAKVASLGRKVTVHYTAKSRESGQMFETTTGKDPFKFRLGKGRKIEGLDVGLDGMRVGGRRRLTIPPALGYGSEGSDLVPPNSWLVLDVELVRVR